MTGRSSSEYEPMIFEPSSATEAQASLAYNVESWSSHVTMINPRNIVVDKPGNEHSCRALNSTPAPQYVLLKLDKPSIVTSIVFGKFQSTTVGNVKRVRVSGGMDASTDIELLIGELLNNGESEMLPVLDILSGKQFACRYIKIEPLESWGPANSYRLWHVKLMGIDDKARCEEAARWYHTYREQEVIRTSMKQHRQENLNEIFKGGIEDSEMRLQHSSLSNLYHSFVVQGNFEFAEKFMVNSLDTGLLDGYLSPQKYNPTWRLYDTINSPTRRGGHSLCMDKVSKKVYLLGGWDGEFELCDLWEFDVKTEQWSLISNNVYNEGGPCPRSCHKMVYDPIRGEIFLLGKFIEAPNRANHHTRSDFYKYNVEDNKWTLLFAHTNLVGGPQSIYDHQMCLDEENSVIYVYGGKVLKSAYACDDSSSAYSGLYSYDIKENKWQCLSAGSQVEDAREEAPARILTPRSGHCMVYDSQFRKLYIFGGMDRRDVMNDFLSYDVQSGDVDAFSDYMEQSAKDMPPTGYTQRATIDVKNREIHVLMGMHKDRQRRIDDCQTSVWVFSLRTFQWTCVYKNDNSSMEYWAGRMHLEPCPRYAHQVVYDHHSKVHYVFGGNPGMNYAVSSRLDDLWRLELQRPLQLEISRDTIFQIRKLKFEEQIAKDPIHALFMLRNNFEGLFDNEEVEHKQRQEMSLYLFKEEEADVAEEEKKMGIRKKRDELFEKLSSYFPQSMREARSN